MDVLLLHNITAGNEDHTEEKLVRVLKRHGYKATYASLEKGLNDTALLERSQLVIAAGGDGTVRKTVTRLAGRKWPIGILPLGTANNIAHSLGIKGEVEDIVANWKKCRSRPVDLGVAKGPWGRTTFIEGLGFGLISRTMAILDDFDQHVVYEFPRAEDKLHRDVCVLTALAHEMPPVKARLTIGNDRTKDEFLLLEVLNISRAGPGVVLARDADPSDGRLNVISVPAEDREKLIEQFQHHVGGSRKPPRFQETAVRKLTLTVDPCEIRIDDKIVLTPKEFRNLPDQRAKIDLRTEPGAVNVLCTPK